VVSLWLPSFATDRLQRRQPRSPQPERPPAGPFATVAASRSGIRVAAVNRPAAAAGVLPGLALAEAHALLPGLAVIAAEPAAERAALAAIADWCGRYTPWTAVDASHAHPGRLGGGAGLWLDVSGCTHLFSGEEALLADLLHRLQGFGLAASAATAATPGAAWALARCTGSAATVVAAGNEAEALTPLPAAGLRLPPPTVEALHQVGLRRIGDLLDLPRQALAARFGDGLLARLDQALGRRDEPLSPRLPVPALIARLAFAEPIARGDDIRAATARLLDDLSGRLAAARLGGRRLELTCYRTDGSVARAAIGTGRPVRDPGHLLRLFADKLDGIDAGFGIEVATLAATVAAPLAPAQMGLSAAAEAQRESLALLIDRLSNRLAQENVVHLRETASHVPERACRRVPALAGEPESSAAAPLGAGDEKSRQPRPLELLPWPEPIEVIAPVPDGPPALFRRGRRLHRVARAEGPERIGGEWWLDDAGLDPERQSRIRDYYRIEDGDGRRFWVYREGLYRPDTPPRWYLHGLFP
jgi:protein ImuB